MQSKPICLLAHNGNRFDFPLLVAELRRIKQCFDEEILCADTYEMFRSLDGLSPRYDPNSSNKIGVKTESLRTLTEVTPNKLTTPIQQSPQKRKLTHNDVNSVNNVSPKVYRQSYDTCISNDSTSEQQKLSREKVKMALRFDDANESADTPNVKAGHILKIDAKEVDESERLVRNDKIDNELAETSEDQAESLPEFSSSLEDSDYLQALGEIENDSNDQSIRTKETDKECSPSTMPEMETTNSSSFFSHVTNYTGYHVKTDIVKSHKTIGAECGKDQNIINDKHKSAKILESKNDENLTKSNVGTKKTDMISDINKSLSANCKDVSISHSDKSIMTMKQEKGVKLSEEDACGKGNGLLLKSDSFKKPNMSSVSIFSSTSSSCGAINKSTISTNVYTKPLNTATQYSQLRNGLNSTAKPRASSTTTQNSLHMQSNVSTPKSTPSSPSVNFKSYKLEEIYLRKFGTRPPVSHSAEDDCVTLLKVVKCAPSSLEWIDKNAVLLSSIPMPYQTK